MKFSWISLKYFINLDNITINKLTNLLTIKGFEIDNIHQNKNIDDYIFDIAITANRQDTLSVIGLANELSCILNQNLKNQYQILQYKIKNKNTLNEKNLKYISNIQINKILNINNYKSPSWLINYLTMHDMQSKNLLLDIQKYIKIKWGHEVYLFNIKNLKVSDKNKINNCLTIQTNKSCDVIKYNNKQLITIFQNYTEIDQNNQNLQYYDKQTCIIACSYIYSNQYLNSTKNTHNTIDNMQGYYEALQLIATFGKAYISKSYLYQSNKKNTNYELNINKNLIHNTLGPINKNKSIYLKQKTIYNILKQLKLKPQYNYYNKNYSIIIPLYRANDLYRKIDIIEEIGRIYGYQNFIDNIPYNHKQGNLSQEYKKLKKIRQFFRDNGLHEVINSSLNKDLTINKNTNYNSPINIYNPLIEDQSKLRYSLLDNLIKTQIYNYKQKNYHIEIFEIGKVFNKHIQTHVNQEIINIAGIVSNPNFIRKSWEDKPFSLNWYHTKGLIEQFFEKMQTQITWDPIDTINHHEITTLSLHHFDLQKTICIRNTMNQKIIGFIGLINQDNYKLTQNNIINIFEFNINGLIYNNKTSDFLHSFNKYSIYPSVTRDISIKVNKNRSINDIKKIIYQLNTKLIQQVEVFNQYRDINNTNKKCVGIRITYNSTHRTLDQNDLQIIEKDIKFILQNYQY